MPSPKSILDNSTKIGSLSESEHEAHKQDIMTVIIMGRPNFLISLIF